MSETIEELEREALAYMEISNIAKEKAADIKKKVAELNKPKEFKGCGGEWHTFSDGIHKNPVQRGSFDNYPTKEIAERVYEHIKYLHVLANLHVMYDKDFVPDYKDGKQVKHFPIYDYSRDKWTYGSRWLVQPQGIPFSASVIDKVLEELTKIYPDGPPV